jgi:hypothetical protein
MTPQRAWRNYMRGEISALDRRVEKFRRRYDPAFYRPDHRIRAGRPVLWERLLDRASLVSLAIAIVILATLMFYPFVVELVRHPHAWLYGGWIFPMLLTRACAWCDAELGEKCPLCGEEATALPNCLMPPGDWFACKNLRCEVIRFVRGAGGVTHGICDGCGKKENSQNSQNSHGPAATVPQDAMAGAAGLEPATPCLEGRCSIHLSYAPGAALFRLSDYRTDATLPPVERADRLRRKAVGLIDQSANEMQKSVNLGVLVQERQKRRAGGAQ